MLKKPDLADHKIQTCLHTFWKIQFRQLEFLPIGNDSSAWVYRIQTANESYFLKVRKGRPHPAVLQIPHYLKHIGIQNVVAPIPTTSDTLFVIVEDFTLIVYNWIDGTSAWGMTLSNHQWQTWGEIMKRIHDTPLTPSLTQLINREAFICKWDNIFKQINQLVQTSTFTDTIQQQTADYWQDHQATINHVYQRLQAIGTQLQQQSHAFVICHADIHQANIMIDKQGQIYIVDWDEVINAPKERDLMFFVEDGHHPHQIEAFLQGYGTTKMNQLAITYYRYEWVVQELADYGQRIFLDSDLSITEKQFALDEFKQLFSAGDVVESALSTDQKS